jgi:hypothetical protein
LVEVKEDMKVLIQDRDTRKYVTASGEWANDAQKAVDFESHRKAWEFARQSKIHGFNIMLYSTIGRYLFCVDSGSN